MNKTKKIVLISLYVSLALVFDYIKSFIPFLNMPSGGSINIALIPVVVCSFHLGYKYGFVCGFMWWLISSMLGLNAWFINVPQYLLDYILPSVLPGLCSLFYKNKSIVLMELGIIVMMIIRTLCIVASGAVYWSDAGSSTISAWIFSCGYNLPYSIATMLMLMIVVPIVIKTFAKRVI